MKDKQIDSSRPCALCGGQRKLEQSHVIPQFGYRWAAQAAGKGERSAGPTRPMLCGECEDLFSSYESEFARRVFHPLAIRSILNAKYTAWLRQFAASVCWRILEVRVAENQLRHFKGRWSSELVSCRDTWRRYLTHQRPDVGEHHLHLLTLNEIGGAPVPSPFQPTVESEVHCTDAAALVCARLGPVLLIGLIADPAPREWQGTRINAEGKLKPRDVVIPATYRDFILSRADGPT